MNNQYMARILLSNKLATEVQIQEYWTKIDVNHNIGELLRDAGILSSSMYEKVRTHTEASTSKDAVKKTVEIKETQPISHETAEIVVEGNSMYSGTSLPATVQLETVSGLESTSVFSFTKTSSEEISEDELSSSLPSRFAMNDSNVAENEVSAPETITPVTPLDELLAFAKKYMATDIYLKTGFQVVIRCSGVQHRVSEALVEASHLNEWLLTAAKGFIDGYKPVAGTDFSKTFSLPGVGRARLTVTWKNEIPELALRLISNDTVRFEELALPEITNHFFTLTSGLVLISGPSGSGKTTTLSAIGEALAEQRPIFLQSVEKPIEKKLKNSAGIVVQREVGLHVVSGLHGISEAIKSGADVLLFDSLETSEELFALLNAASTGMLVFAVTTGNHTAALLSRLSASVPDSQRSLLMGLFSEQLRGVIVQHLIPVVEEQGQVLAVEVLKINSAVSQLIRKEDFMQVSALIATNQNVGCSLDDSLQKWLESGYIEGVEAWQRAFDTRRFASYRPDARKGA